MLNGLLKEQVLDDGLLQLLLCEVESIITGHTLTTVSDDPGDVAALTPNHLLLLKSNYCMPPFVFSNLIVMENGDGNKSSTLRIFFGRDGPRSTT